ncbi:hypothetical protein PSYJYH_000019 [Bacillus phage PSYJ-YH]|nr:hypothetical protein PSYJYH_000019 [Bacillus phage PSYJ-YH]
MRIALCGEARAGKDTVAKLLPNFTRLAFGDYMKYYYYKDNPHMRNLPKDGDHMVEWSQPQVEKDNLIWVRKLERSFNSLIVSGFNNIVITDLRQPHEEKWCRENGFHIVRVHSDIRQRKARMLALGENTDREDLPYWVNADFHVYNSGNFGGLERNCEKLLTILETSDKIKTVTEEVNIK